jgi:hypothetical protein
VDAGYEVRHGERQGLGIDLVVGEPYVVKDQHNREEAFDESAHLGLVTTLQREGRHGEARRQYRAYAARMVEFQVPAAPFPSPKRA